MSRGVLAGSGAFRSLGRSIAFASGSFLGGVGFTVLLKQSISAASDLVEQTNKANVVFRSSAGEIRSWAKTSAESMGIAQHDALALAATFGNLLVPMGFTRKGAADMSKSLVGLAADLASFNNASPEETLHALQSGLVGQVRPLRQFGIFLSDDRVKAEALSSGIVKANVSLSKLSQAQTAVSIAEARVADARKNYGTGTTQYASAVNQLRRAHEQVHKALGGQTVALTDAQKAQARYNIILKDSKDAQGDFSRTSGDLANQQRILKAHLSDLEGEIGTALLPTVLNLTKRLNTWIQHAQKTGDIQRYVNQAVRIGTGVFNAIHDAVEAVTPVVKNVNDALGGTKHTIELLLAVATFKKLRSLADGLGLIGTNARTAAGQRGVGGLLTNLKKLPTSPITVAIAVVVTAYYGNKLARHLIGDSGSGPFGLGEGVTSPAGDLKPVLRNGKWVDPNTGKPVADQAYWNEQARKGNVSTGNRLRRGGQSIPSVGQSSPRQQGIAGAAVRYANEPEARSASYAIPGGRRPQGFQDCSSFTQAVYRQNGISIGGNTVTQWNGAPHKGKRLKDAVPGDLLFYYYHNGTSGPPDHVAIYIGGGRQVEDHGRRTGVTTGYAGGKGFYGWGRYVKGGVPTKTADDEVTSPPGDLVVGKKRTAAAAITGENLLPAPIQSQMSHARTTRDRGDDLKALDRAIDWVSGQLKRHDLGRKKRQQYEKLLTQLNRERDRDETQLEGRIKTPRIKPTRSYLRAVGSYGDITSGRSRRTEIDPVLGKVSVPISTQPTIADYKRLIKKLDDAYAEIKKKLTAAQKKKGQVARALKRALRMHHRNPKHIHNLRQTIANLDAQIIEYKTEMKNLREDIIQARGALADLGVTAPGDLPTDLESEFADAEAAGDIQGEIDVLGKEADFLQHELDTGVDEYGHQLTPEERLKIKNRLAGVNKQRTDLLQGLQDAREAGLIDLPDTIKLDLAQATLTPETTDDLAALVKAEDYYSRALQTPNLSTEGKIALINALHDVREQIKSLKGETSSSAMAFLTDLRDIRQYESTLTGRLGSGTQVTVTNNFAGAPSDPHTFSANMAFDLKALVN